ncbi:MAG TPA: Ppx/GppA family phosphatase, partial [Bacteroidales bacterium]|nr:Ppx/GppA family phosphatase [Bacteroidales bacterium]
YSLSLKDLKKGLKKLNSLTVEQRVDKMGLRPDRADVIVPAAEIFLAIMNTTQSEYVNVPRIGLSDGLIYSLYKKYKEKNI